MNDQGVDRLFQQVQLIEGEIIQLLEIVLDGVDYLVVGALHRTHEVGGDGGNDGADWLYGGDGNDTLTGGANFDQIFGGRGDDQAFGGDGNDIVYGQEGNERWSILRQEMRLGAGDHERSVTLPTLHALRLRLPANWGGNVVLTTKDPALGYAQRTSRARDGIASFDALAPGAYEVQAGNRRMEVRVPGPPEVIFE